jgi:hypothetical protein
MVPLFSSIRRVNRDALNSSVVEGKNTACYHRSQGQRQVRVWSKTPGRSARPDSAPLKPKTAMRTDCMKIMSIGILVTLVGLTGCAALAAAWPDRTNKSPEQMLADVIRWQQHVEVRKSTGEWAYECFTDVDFDAFVRAKRPEKVVEWLKTAPDFRTMVTALRSLPAEKREKVFAEARLIAHPTWRQLGFIDRSGNGQTEAGHQAERLMATAMVGAFEAAAGVD